MEWHNSVQSTNQISLSCNVNTLILMFISISIVPAKTLRMFIVNFSFRVTGLKFKWSNYVMTGLALVLASPAAGTVGRWWGTSSLGGPRTGWVSQREIRGVTWTVLFRRDTSEMEITCFKSETSDCGEWEHSRYPQHPCLTCFLIPNASFLIFS